MISPSGFEYQYAQVRTVSFREDAHPETGDVFDVRYRIEPALAFDASASVLAIRLHVEALLSEPGQESALAFAEVETENVFALRGLDEMAGPDAVVRLPRMFVGQCLGIACSTARGVLVGRGRTPLLQNAPLPILSPVDLLAEMGDMPDWVDNEDRSTS